MSRQASAPSGAARSARGTPARGGAKKFRYVSFNPDEDAALEKLGFRERWAYFRIKWICNFKTGVVGEHKDQRLTYADIAKMVTAPAAQGRGQGGIDDTQAKDFLDRMEAVGLVANRSRRANGGLSFELPLSPIERKTAAPSGDVAGKVAGKVQDISPDDAPPPILENIAPPWEKPEWVPQLACTSVLINKKENISNEGADPADAEAAPCRATGAAAYPERGAARSADAPMTARDIQDTFAANWTFSQTEVPEALALYATWAQAGISRPQLEAAMTSVEEFGDEAAPTPAAVAARLWAYVVDQGLSA